MTASYELICFLAWPLPGTAVGILCNCLVRTLPYAEYTVFIRDMIIPLVRSKGYPPRASDLTRPPAMATAKGCLLYTSDAADE